MMDILFNADASAAEEEMLVFDRDYSQRKSFIGGTHRMRSPAETLRLYEPLMPRLGITRLANVTGLDCVGLPVYIAIRPNSRSLSVSQGKGSTADAARASALMETIELWHAERASLPLRYASYADLARDVAVVDIDKLSRRPGSQLRADTPLFWAAGYDIIQRRDTYVPFEMVNLNLVGNAYDLATFEMSSNGLASGNHLLEAILHALCEVVERDSVTLSWLGNRETLNRRKVHIDSIDDENCRGLIGLLRNAGIDVSLWDVTGDNGLPTFMAAIAEESGRPHWRTLGAFWGYGCHLSAAVAVARAVTEAAQARLTIIAGSRDDVFHGHFVRQTNLEALKSLRVGLLDTPPQRDFDGRDLSTDTFDGDLAVATGALERIGIRNVVVIDLTKPDIGVPVVKVIVPGLEAYVWDERFQPGERARSKMERGDEAVLQ
jgi:YcaO-like protein with predicted kinase domain